ncbi:MAG: hypothetical protein IT458_16430 [Planctomycetes bacterium]|nr:hypothetical protein [Planctomycetota bacterium]
MRSGEWVRREWPRVRRTLGGAARAALDRWRPRWTRRAPRRERRWFVGAAGFVVLALLLVLAARAGRAARGPHGEFAPDVLDLQSVFAWDERSPGSPLSLREVYERARDLWAATARGAAARLATDRELQRALEQAAERLTRVTVQDLRRIVAIESAARVDVGVNRFGYSGLFQLGAAACADVGTTLEEVRADWRSNVAAGARFAELQHRRLADLLARSADLRGVSTDSFLLYLAHQQGAMGALDVLQRVHDGSAAVAPIEANHRHNFAPGSGLVRRLEEGGRTPTLLEYYVYLRGVFDAVVEEVG